MPPYGVGVEVEAALVGVLEAAARAARAEARPAAQTRARRRVAIVTFRAPVHIELTINHSWTFIRNKRTAIFSWGRIDVRFSYIYYFKANVKHMFYFYASF